MKKVEEMLEKKKIDIDELRVPEELESRLYKALESTQAKRKIKRSNPWWIKGVAMFLIIIFVGYNFNTLAFYSKKLMGFDNIMNGTLKELNELGKGQVIDKGYTFNNGVSITLEGIMIDEGQLLAFYTVSDPRGNVDRLSYQSQMYMKGLFKGYHMLSGQGEMNDERTEIKWLMAFEPPRFFERNLSFKTVLEEDGRSEEAEITFKIDRDKAMKHSLKKNLNVAFEVEYTKIKIESIVASPTQTVINGSIQNILQLAKDQILGERIRPNNINIKLVANNKEVAKQGAGMTTNMKGMTFENRFDALPADLHSLEIHLESFAVDKNVNGVGALIKNSENENIEVLGRQIEINEVYELAGSTYVTITTEEDIVLTRVYLLIDGNRIDLKETITEKHEKLMDGNIIHTRRLNFPATGIEQQLIIERMSFLEEYNQVIKVPVE